MKKSENIITANIVMLGVLARYLLLKEDIIIETIKKSVPKRLIDANLEAFELGKSVG